MSFFGRFATLTLIFLVFAGAGQRAEAQAPDLTYQLTPSNFTVDASGSIVYTIDNTARVAVTGLGFTHTLPTTPGALTVFESSASHTCGSGTLTANNGSGTVTFSGGTLDRDSICNITIPIAANVAGTYSVGTVTLNSSAGSDTATSSTLTVSAASILDVIKTISPAAIKLGDVARVNYTFMNTQSAGGTNLFQLTFAETLPAGIKVATPPNAVTTCSGAASSNFSASADGSAVSYVYSGFNFAGFELLAPQESCSIAFDVVGSSVNDFTLTSDPITYNSGQAFGTKSAMLAVEPPIASEPQISKTFSPALSGPGDIVDLTFAIMNPSRTGTMTDVSFTDDLAAMLAGTVATGLPVSNSCGSGSTVSGTSVISLTGGTLPAGGSCSFTVQVQLPAGAPAGDVTNVTSAVTASFEGTATAGSDTATANLTIQAAQPLSWSRAISPATSAPGTTSTFTYTISNPNATDATAGTFSENFGAIFPSTNSYTGSGVGCGAGTLTTSSSTSEPGFIVSNLTILANATCTFTANVPIPASTPSGTYAFTSTDLSTTINGATVTTDRLTGSLNVSGSASVKLNKVFNDTLDGTNNGAVVNGSSLEMVLTLSSAAESSATATAIGFTDDLNTFSNGTTGSVTGNTCDGTAAMNAGNNLLTVSGASLAPDADCAITLQLTVAATSNGNATNTISDGTFTAGGVAGSIGDASATIFLGTVQPIIQTHAYSPSTVLAGATPQITYTFTNLNPSDDATGYVLTHNLSAVLSGLASTGSASDTCGFTTNTGTTFVILSGGTILAGTSCEVVLNLAVPAGASSGSYAGPTGTGSATIDGSNVSSAPSNATLIVENEPLLFAKSFSVNTAAPGDTVELEFTLENPLSVALTTVAFTDDLDAMLTGSLVASNLSNTCGGTFATGGSTLTYAGGSLAANATCTVRVGVSIPASAADGGYTNTSSTVTADAGGASVTSNVATDTLTINALANTEFTLAFASGGQVNAGGSVTGLYTIRNTGSGALSDLKFSHDLGAAVPGMVATNLPLSNTCGTGSATSGTGTIAFTGGMLAAGANCQFGVDFTVPGTTPAGTVTSTTSALTSNGAVVTTAASGGLTINAVADIGVTMTDSATTAVSGQSTTYVTVVSNSGPSTDPAMGLNINLSGTSGCTITPTETGGATGATAAGPGVTTATQTLAMPSGSSVTYSAVCTIAPSAAGTLDVSSTVTPSVIDNVPANNTARDNDTVLTQSGDLSVTLSDAADPVNAGDALTYAVNVSNAGPSVAANTTATFTLPAGLTLVSTSGCAEDPSGVPTCALGDLAPLGAASFTVVANGTENILTTATANVSVASDATEATPGNNTAGETTTVTQLADLNITKTDGVTSVNAGETVSYVIAASNLGPSPDPAARILDTFDVNTNSCTISPTLSGGATLVSSGSSVTGIDDTYNMPVGGSVSYNVACTVDPTFVGTLSNTATATASVTDPVTGNNSATDNDTVVSANHDLTISKTDGVTSAVAGTSVTYTIVVGNAGPSAATGAVVTDTFASDLTCTYTSVGAGGATGTTASGAGNISDTLGLPVGATVTYSASCLIAPTTTGMLSNTATITGTGTDPAPANNTATDADTAITPLTFNFTKAFAPTAVDVGQTSVLTLTIDNTANALTAQNLAFNDPLPTGMTLAAVPNASTTCVGGTLSAVGGAGSLDLSGASVAGGSVCTVTASVLTTAAGSLTNTTSVLTSTFPDAGPAVANLAVNPAGAPLFTKAFTASSVAQGETTTLTLAIDNTANSVAATTMAFTDTFPSGMVVASLPALSNTCGGTATATSGAGSVSLTGGTVAANANCAISVAVRATGSGDLINTSGDLTSDLPTATGPSATLQSVPAQMVFGQFFAPATVVQGGETTVTFTIDNSANSIEATALAFSNALAGGLIVADVPSINNSCGGTVTAAAGSTTISLAGGAVIATGRCSISVDVSAPDAGSISNTTSVLTSSLADVAAATAVLDVTAADALTFAQAFTPASITQGETSILTFSLTNANLISADALAFSNTLPSGVSVANIPGATTTCGGSFAPNAGDSALTFTGGVLADQSACEVSVTVSAVAAGDAVNVSSTLTSSTVPASPTSTATLAVTAAAAPGFAKAFSVSPIVQGDITTLTLSIDNGASLVEATSLAFVDTFPAGMVVAPTPNATSTCVGGSITAVAGSGSLSYSGGSVAAGATCDVVVDVRAINAGIAINTTGDLTSSLGNSGTASATLEVTATAGPTFAKAFSPPSIAQGNVSTLTYTIDNSVPLVDAASLGFTDSFPAGLMVATLPNASTTCSGGTVSAAAAASTVSFTGGTVSSGAICTVSVDVTSTTVGTTTTTSGALTSTSGTGGTAAATLIVTPASAPLLAQSFQPAQIVQGGVTNLVLTINNTGNGVGANNVGVSAFLTGATISGGGFSNTCGGTLTAVPGSGAVILTGGTVAAGSSCQITVPVTSTTLGSASLSATFSSSLGGQTLTSVMPLIVIANPNGQVTFVQQTDEDGSFGFVSSEAALNFTIATVGGTGSAGPLTVPAGTYSIRQQRPAGVGNTSLSCSDANSTTDPATGTVTLRLEQFENVTCTYSSVNSARESIETINAFMQRRNNLILSNGPNRARRLARLTQGIGTSQSLTYQNGDLQSFAPVGFNLRSIGSGNYSISTSLSQVERASAMFVLAHDGIEGNSVVLENRRFDVWFEAHYNKFEASGASAGHFGIAYLGADYLVNNDVLAGFMLQYDTLRDENAANATSVDGTGWMAGPYVTARVAPNLIFDGRMAWGKSTNDIILPTSTGKFDTKRFLIDLNLSGDFDWNDWVVSPNVGISYIEDSQDSYVNSLNVTVPGQKVSLGQAKFGPTFSKSYMTTGQMLVQPSFSVTGIYNFANTSGVLITNNTADETDGFRGRIEANVKTRNRFGTEFNLGANYDGIGKSDFESWGVTVGIKIPLQ